jgi:hypothetical protein
MSVEVQIGGDHPQVGLVGFYHQKVIDLFVFDDVAGRSVMCV